MQWIKWTSDDGREYFENVDAVASFGQLSNGTYYIKYVGMKPGENVSMSPRDFELFRAAFLEHYNLFNGIDTTIR